MAIVVSSLLENGPMVPFRMVSAAKLSIPEFPEPIRAGSLDFSEQYLSHGKLETDPLQPPSNIE